ncbi:hypothetical protein HPB49_004956 [Dermacentor silvarum]|uniref:Uncharacterized protein n=1 Tax=Dermacentor silvarum TaxID=543639 RepID=A0ACB8C799_DERSI|nr:hypothetical protein HPB49_004956 [Dermacentor silvarum]
MQAEAALQAHPPQAPKARLGRRALEVPRPIMLLEEPALPEAPEVPEAQVELEAHIAKKGRRVTFDPNLPNDDEERANRVVIKALLFLFTYDQEEVYFVARQGPAMEGGMEVAMEPVRKRWATRVFIFVAITYIILAVVTIGHFKVCLLGSGSLFPGHSSSSLPDANKVTGNIVAATCQARYLGFCIRKGLPPREITAIFGSVFPSWGHIKRMCKILRSELGRQVRLFNDLLRCMCYTKFPSWVATKKLKDYRKVVSIAIETTWNSMLSCLLRSMNKATSMKSRTERLNVIGDTNIPDDIANLLNKGPKYGLEPQVPAQEFLAWNRQVAKKAPQEQRERCLLDGVDSLHRAAPKAGTGLGSGSLFPGHSSSSLPDANKVTGNIVAATCQARYLGFCIRKGLPPREITAIFGSVFPSWGHIKRMCKILRSELGRQVRLFNDLLRCMCYTKFPSWVATKKLKDYRKVPLTAKLSKK